MTTTVAIIDYGMGNLGSVRRAFEECGANVIMASRPEEISEATHLVLPGVGAFSQGMQNLKAGGWVPFIRRWALEEKKPFLGICLGMQLMASRGIEGGESEGLDLIPGLVEKMRPTSADSRIPHVGWNEVLYDHCPPLLEGIPSGTDFYFVHSFQFRVAKPDQAAGSTPYCGTVASVVGQENIFGVQFHPEKSQRPGFALLKNFLRLAC